MKITQKNDGYEYDFGSDVRNIEDELNQGVTNMTFPNQSSDEAQFLRFSGQTRKISFKFKMSEDMPDRSNKDYSGEIKTVIEQRDYLLNQIFKSKSSISWELSDPQYFPGGIDVCIKNLSISKSGSDPLRFDCRIELLVGSNLV